jgi:hypothetical protein
MTSLIFETKRFRVQVMGKTAWVESREGEGWIFRNQHTLPVALGAWSKAGDDSVLRAAVRHFEQIHKGDSSLRAALTGPGETKGDTVMNPAVPVAPIAKRVSLRPRRGRLPLRPPLAAI